MRTAAPGGRRRFRTHLPLTLALALTPFYLGMTTSAGALGDDGPYAEPPAACPARLQFPDGGTVDRNSIDSGLSRGVL